MKYASVIESQFTVITKSGSEFSCACPWCHGTKNVLYANAYSGLYICFQCGEKGSLDAIGQLPVVSTNDVRERLRRMAAPQQETTYYPEGWLRQFDVPTSYWTEQRGLPEATVKQFGLGFDPFSGRVTLPLRDVRGRVLGVTYRRLDDGKPKYLHPKGFPIGRHLYGAWLLKEQRTIALVEGQVDAIRCWSERVPALALMGSRLTADQTKVLQRLNLSKVVLMLDNDAAGQRGTVAVYEALQGAGIQVQAGWYRPYWRVKDPDGLKGDRLRKMFHSSVTLPEWAKKVASQ